MAHAFRDVNFIPDEIITERKQRAKLSKGNRIAIGLAIFSLLAGSGLWGYNYYNQSEIQKSEEQIAANQKKIEDLKDFGETGYQLGSRLEKSNDILENRIYFSKLFEEFTNQIPKSITVRSWQINESGSINLSASSFPNYSPIALFQKNLISSETGIFKDMRLQSASLNNKEGNVSFSVRIEVNLEALKE